MEDIPCSTTHLKVHSADLGVQVHKTLCKLIFACNACLYYTASYCIVTIYYCGDTAHVKLFILSKYIYKGPFIRKGLNLSFIGMVYSGALGIFDGPEKSDYIYFIVPLQTSSTKFNYWLISSCKQWQTQQLVLVELHFLLEQLWMSSIVTKGYERKQNSLELCFYSNVQ